MKFELTVSFSDQHEDVQVELAADAEGADRTLATALAHVVFNLNNGVYKELFQKAINEHALLNEKKELAHLIFDEWQKLVLQHDNFPEISADDSSRIGQAF